MNIDSKENIYATPNCGVMNDDASHNPKQLHSAEVSPCSIEVARGSPHSGGGGGVQTTFTPSPHQQQLGVPSANMSGVRMLDQQQSNNKQCDSFHRRATPPPLNMPNVHQHMHHQPKQQQRRFDYRPQQQQRQSHHIPMQYQPQQHQQNYQQGRRYNHRNDGEEHHLQQQQNHHQSHQQQFYHNVGNRQSSQSQHVPLYRRTSSHNSQHQPPLTPPLPHQFRASSPNVFTTQAPRSSIPLGLGSSAPSSRSVYASKPPTRHYNKQRKNSSGGSNGLPSFDLSPSSMVTFSSSVSASAHPINIEHDDDKEIQEILKRTMPCLHIGKEQMHSIQRDASAVTRAVLSADCYAQICDPSHQPFNCANYSVAYPTSVTGEEFDRQFNEFQRDRARLYQMRTLKNGGGKRSRKNSREAMHYKNYDDVDNIKNVRESGGGKINGDTVNADGDAIGGRDRPSGNSGGVDGENPPRMMSASF